MKLIYAKDYSCDKEIWLEIHKPNKAKNNQSEEKDIYEQDRIVLKKEIDKLLEKKLNEKIIKNYGDNEKVIKQNKLILEKNKILLAKDFYLKNKKRGNNYFIKYDYLYRNDNEYTIYFVMLKKYEKLFKDYVTKNTYIPKILYSVDILKTYTNNKINVKVISLEGKEFKINDLSPSDFSESDINKYGIKYIDTRTKIKESCCSYSRKCKKCKFRDYCNIEKLSVVDLESTPNCWRKIDPIIKENNSLNLGDLTQEQINTLYPHQMARYGAYNDKNGVYYNMNIIEEFIDVIKDGYINLDFETYSSILPINDKYDNYSQIPFSFSYDLIDENDNFVESYVYTVDYMKEDFDSLVLEMIKTIPDNKPIVVYNKTFEITRIKEFIKLYPQYEEILNRYIDNIIDLYEVFSKGGYYDLKFNGSLSLKSIYPVLCKSNDYENLNINHGDDCANIYKELFNNKIKNDENDKIMNDIKLYNAKDTSAQTEIINKLKELIK